MAHGQDSEPEKRTASKAQLERARRHFVRGRRAYQRGELEDARRAFLQAYRDAPSAELAYNLGRVLERTARPEQARRFYRIYLRDGAPDARERREVERRIEQLAALSARFAAQPLKPPPSKGELAAEARAFFVRGAKLYARGRFEDALIAFGAAQRYATLPELSFNMGLAAERLGRLRDAVDHYRAYLRAAKGASDAAAVERHIVELAGAHREGG